MNEYKIKVRHSKGNCGQPVPVVVADCPREPVTPARSDAPIVAEFFRLTGAKEIKTDRMGRVILQPESNVNSARDKYYADKSAQRLARRRSRHSAQQKFHCLLIRVRGQQWERFVKIGD